MKHLKAMSWQRKRERPTENPILAVAVRVRLAVCRTDCLQLLFGCSPAPDSTYTLSHLIDSHYWTLHSEAKACSLMDCECVEKLGCRRGSWPLSALVFQIQISLGHMTRLSHALLRGIMYKVKRGRWGGRDRRHIERTDNSWRRVILMKDTWTNVLLLGPGPALVICPASLIYLDFWFNPYLYQWWKTLSYFT